MPLLPTRKSLSEEIVVESDNNEELVEESPSVSHSERSEDDNEDDQSGSDSSVEEDGTSQEALLATQTTSPTQALPYAPPPGFQPATISFSSRSLRDLFAKKNLQGKQIWHITAPSSVPISSIKEVPVRQVTAGGPILSYEGSEYGLITETVADHGEKVLLLPSDEHNCYQSAAGEIERTLYLQQIVKPPIPYQQAGSFSNGATKAPRTHVKVFRQQLEGLRMRYRPFGDNSASEDSDAAPRFKLPPILSTAQLSKAKKPPFDNNKSSPPKGRAKHEGTPEKTNANGAISEALRSARDSSFKKSSKFDRPVSQADERSSTALKRKETSDEKAKWRADRKRRKELKAYGPQDVTHIEELPGSRNHQDDDPAVASVTQTHEKLPELEKIKTKRKKRKSEATDDI
ncbi:MAG: hypothetical protein Q9166_007412 [cf. Caloplaca sp. 2 TL-2023]